MNEPKINIRVIKSTTCTGCGERCECYQLENGKVLCAGCFRSDGLELHEHSDLELRVGAIIVLPGNGRNSNAVWKVTGLHYGASYCEDLASLQRLDKNAGSAFGKTTDSIVPIAILNSNARLINA